MFFLKNQKSKESLKTRKRYLYILMFPGRYCYVGQTVNIKRRKSEHKRAWDEPFYMYTLNYIKGNRYDAEEYEYAWRYKAQQKGLKIYGSPEKYVVDPSARMTKYRKKIARKLHLPRKLKAPKNIRGRFKVLLRNFLIFLILFGCIVSLGYYINHHPQVLQNTVDIIIVIFKKIFSWIVS